jgi:hypothetical protein
VKIVASCHVQYHFYKKYHPHLAYKDQRIGVPAKRNDLHFSYLFDIQTVLHPAFCNCKLFHHIIMSLPDVTMEEKQRHFSNIHGYSWCAISQLVQQVAYQLLTSHTNTISDQEVPEPGKKNICASIADGTSTNSNAA